MAKTKTTKPSKKPRWTKDDREQKINHRTLIKLDEQIHQELNWGHPRQSNWEVHARLQSAMQGYWEVVRSPAGAPKRFYREHLLKIATEAMVAIAHLQLYESDELTTIMDE